METVYDAAARVYSRQVRQWKEKGGQVVAGLCSFVPSEVLHAAGILPIRLRGIEAEDLDIANAYYGPFICSCPKSILQMVCEGRYSFLDGAVITPGCDSMRRLYDCWEKAGRDYDGIMPPFFTYFGVPHKAPQYSVDWFSEEIRRLISLIQDHFRVSITEDRLKEAISTYNRGRKLVYKLQELRMLDDPKISGTDALAVAIAGTSLPREEYNRILETIIEDPSCTRSRPGGQARRLMVLGSVCDETSLVKLIEDAGGVVVADNLCFGPRYTGGLVREDGDPVRSLALWYLGECVCPRMFGGFEERMAAVLEKIEQAGVEGVVLQNIRFCDLHGAENGLFAKQLERRGVPCLELEREYGPLVDTGRLKMRIDAFMERLS